MQSLKKNTHSAKKMYPHIAAECMFVLVVLLLRGHVWGSIRVHLL